jgi:hypothetical protein
MRRVGKWLHSAGDRAADRIAPDVRDLGWEVAPSERWSAAYMGRDHRGLEFTVLAVYGDTEASSDILEWRGGPPRLDELHLAVANVPGRAGRSWLRSVHIPEGLEGPAVDGQVLRAELDALAAGGASVDELNAHALEAGAGGVDGLVLRFEQTGVEVEPGVDGLHVIASSPEVAAQALTDDVRARFRTVAASALVAIDSPTFVAFGGSPFSRIRVEPRWASLELLQELAELGAELRAVLARRCDDAS